jgi:hypothetical protein
MTLEAQLAEVVALAIKAATGPLLARIAALETQTKAAGPVGPKGADGAPGRDGVDGKDGLAGADGAPGRDGMDGKDGLAGKDGAPGRDGRDGQAGAKGIDGQPGAKGIDGSNGRDGKDGLDGLGFDDLDVVHDGERGFTFRFTKAGRVKAFPFTLPVVIYRGVWTGGKAYARGDQVTAHGSSWTAMADTTEVPGDGATAWVLSSKRGRDGKTGVQGEKGLDGRPGRDLTQMDDKGRKW